MNPCMGSLSNTMRMKALACARGCSDHHFDIDACSVRHAQMGRAFRGRGKEHPRPRALSLDGPSIAIARSSTPHAGRQCSSRRHRASGGRGATPLFAGAPAGRVRRRRRRALIPRPGGGSRSRYSQFARRSASPTTIVPRATKLLRPHMAARAHLIRTRSFSSVHYLIMTSTTPTMACQSC